MDFDMLKPAEIVELATKKGMNNKQKMFAGLQSPWASSMYLSQRRN